MSKLGPIWQNLPQFFKKDVVSKLDYKDRCSLRKCSKSELDLVDSTPNQLYDVAINTFENYSYFSFSDRKDTVFTVKYYKNLEESDARIEFLTSPRVYLPGKNQKIISKKSVVLDDLPMEMDDLDMVLIDFKVVLRRLKAQKLLLNGLIIPDYHPMAHPERTMEFRERLLELLRLSEPKLKVHCLSLHWHQEQSEIIEILQKFDAKTLKSLEFLDRNATWSMKEVVKMDQFQNASKIHLEVLTDLQIEDIAHFSEVQMHVRDMDEQDVWRVIQNFISKNQHGTSFHFSYRQGEPDPDRIKATFDVPPKDEPVRPQTRLRSVLNTRFFHTQRFQMADPNLVLVVMIGAKEVSGTVCRKDQVDVEAKVESGMMR